MSLEAKTIIALLAIITGTYLFVLGHPGAKESPEFRQINLVIIIGKDTTMPFGIESIIGGIIGAGADWTSTREQMKDQAKLMQQQEMASMRLGRFNKDMALELWRDTNYPAQVEQMRKAGLNVGLMYKGGGPGGSTNIAPGAMPNTSGAPRANLGMGMQIALQMEMQKAQIENVKADTATKEAQVPQIQAQTKYTEIQTGNAKIDGDIKSWQRELLSLETQKQGASLEASISIIKSGAEKLIAEVKTAQAGAEVATASKDDAIAKIKNDATTAYLMVRFTEGMIIKQNADIDQVRAQAQLIAKQINNLDVVQSQKWTELGYDKRKTIVSEELARLQGKMTEFNTSDARSAQQWIDAIMGGADIATSIKGLKK